jgi:exonuclease III
LRGTAILTKEGLQVNGMKRIPSGRGISVRLENVWYINIYALSGTGKRAERETFFNQDVLHLIPDTPAEQVLAGDFNSVIQHTDTTGSVAYSKALEKLIKGLELHDVWDHTVTNRGYTHYAPKSASRLDTIYTSKIQYCKKKCRNHRHGLYGSFRSCIALGNRRTHGHKREWILENEHLHIIRPNLSLHAKQSMENMATRQASLP